MISVIIPIYNTKLSLVDRCLESILIQTKIQLEIIVVLNGCTDQYIKK